MDNSLIEQLLSDSAKPLKKKIVKEETWWEVVQEEVKREVEWVIDNLPRTYETFPNLLYWQFIWECDKREMRNQKPFLTYEQAIGNLDDPQMTDVSYHCGKEPVKAILGLQDWTMPNDADVYACLFLRRQIISLMDSFAKIHQDILNNLQLPGMSETNGDEKNETTDF